MPRTPKKTVLLVVAHPDDETLWAGGTLLSNPSWDCFALCMCRGSDADRAPKFHKALHALGAIGVIADLDDGPDQHPLKASLVESAILRLMPSKRFDLLITHSPRGEYTRHLRHEEVGKAVINIWNDGNVSAHKLQIFAYEDGERRYYPKPIKIDTQFNKLPKSIWERKYAIMTNIYGFAPDSWEAQTTPKAEAFWLFDKAKEAQEWSSYTTELR